MITRLLPTALTAAIIWGLCTTLPKPQTPHPTVALGAIQEDISSEELCDRSWKLIDHNGQPATGLTLVTADGLLGTTDEQGSWSGRVPCHQRVDLRRQGWSDWVLYDHVDELQIDTSSPIDVVVQVRDGTGAPAPEVPLALRPSTNWSRETWLATTNADGIAHFRVTSAFEYELTHARRRPLVQNARLTPLPSGTLTTQAMWGRIPVRWESGSAPARSTIYLPSVSAFQTQIVGLPDEVRIRSKAQCGWFSFAPLEQPITCDSSTSEFTAWGATWSTRPDSEVLGMDLSNHATVKGALTNPAPGHWLHAVRLGWLDRDSASVEVGDDGRFILPGLYTGRWHLALTESDLPPTPTIGQYLGITVDVVEGQTLDLGTVELHPVSP